MVRKIKNVDVAALSGNRTDYLTRPVRPVKARAYWVSLTLTFGHFVSAFAIKVSDSFANLAAPPLE